MQCPRCHAENREGRRFCGECGLSLASTCASCGFLNEGGEKFCGGCGKSLTPSPTLAEPKFGSPQSYTPKHLAEKILTSKAALEGERKQVTVLFADLKGSMELLADRDPEEARKLLDPVLERMMEAVHRYEGTVNQVMGDGIMALFGAPLAHEDHAVRACYAALRMQDAVRRYSDELRRAQGVEVQIRVGLNSGEVVVRSIGSDLRMDYTAVGQTTHLAARMEQLATPGTVRLTGETTRLAEGYVAVRALGPIPVKGLPDPIEIFELTGAGQARTRLQAAALRGLTRFVGRDAEVEHLHRVLGQAGAGRGQVAAIVGEAGVGKSRLTYEFTHSHRVQDWLILEASSVSYGKATSYLPVIDLLKGYFKIGDRDNHREMRDKVMGRVLGLDRALEPLLPPLLALLDVPVDDAAWQTLDAPQRRQRTLDAVKRLLLRESQVQPLLVAFENLHWVDRETQALLDSLVDSLGSARLLLLVNYRPEYQQGWSGKTAYSQMRLDALAAESAGELLDALLGDDPGLAPLKQLLVKRGNPFFLEETVRTLVETKALEGSRGGYRLTQPLRALQVPPTVQAILAARIDRLSPEDKRLLQTASVVGKDVPFALLQGIAELPDEALRGGLDRLRGAEFLYETGLFPDLEYAFKHALTHEVTYSTLLQERRRALHAQIVAAIESLAVDRVAEQVERLAHHALRGEVWDKAVAYCRQTSAKAAGHAAYREAVMSSQQALMALAHLPESHEKQAQTIDVHLDLQACLWQLGEVPQMLDHLVQAETLATTLGDQTRLGAVFSRMSLSLFLISQHDRALEAGERALTIAKSLADTHLEVETTLNLSRIYLTLGDYRAAMDCLGHNLGALEGDQLGQSRESDRERYLMLLLQSRSWLGRCFAELGRFADGVALVESVMQIANESARPFTHVAARRDFGHVSLCRGDIDRAIPALERGVAICRAAPVPGLFPISASLLGAAYVAAGRVAEGLPLLEQAVEQAASSRLMYGQSLWTSLLAEGYLRAGRVDEANTRALEAVEFARTHKEQGYQASALRLLGEIHAHRDPSAVEPAETYYHQALALAEELGMRPLVAHCHLGLGKLYRRTGTREQAQEHLSTATAMYREMDMRFWLAQAGAEMRGLE